MKTLLTRTYELREDSAAAIAAVANIDEADCGAQYAARLFHLYLDGNATGYFADEASDNSSALPKGRFGFVEGNTEPRFDTMEKMFDALITCYEQNK